MIDGLLEPISAHRLRPSMQAPIRRPSMRPSEEAPINFFPGGNACISGVLTEQPAQGQARVADGLKAPINWLERRPSRRPSIRIDGLKAPINWLQWIGAHQFIIGCLKGVLLVSSCLMLHVLSPALR